MTILDTAQRSIIGVFNSLPVILITSLLILGLGFGNFGMIWIFAGQALLFPIVGAIHIFTGFINLGNINYSDTLVIVPTPGSHAKINIVPSMWIVQISYFFAYVFLNANDIRNADPISMADEYDSKVNNRKIRTTMIMACAVIFGVLLVSCRIIAKSEFEKNILISGFSVVSSVVLGGLAAWLWNLIGRQPNIGIEKLDIFGITQQMMIIPRTSEVTLCQVAGSNQ